MAAKKGVKLNNKITSRALEVTASLVGLEIAKRTGTDRYIGVIMGGLLGVILTEALLPDSKSTLIQFNQGITFKSIN